MLLLLIVLYKYKQTNINYPVLEVLIYVFH